MIPIAGVLLLIVVVFSIAIVISNPAILDLSIFGAHLPVTAGGVYFTGAAAMLVLVLALDLLRRGIRREVRRRRRVKSLQAAASGATRGTGPQEVGTAGVGTAGAGTAGAGTAGVDGSTNTENSSTPHTSSSAQDRPSSGQDHRAAVPSADGGRSEIQDSDSRASESTASGATALGSASLPERQALLDEAEELTGGDARR